MSSATTAPTPPGKVRPYTLLEKDLLPPSAALSARAWGVFAYLRGQPPGWQARASHLATVFAEGRDALQKTLDELTAAALVEQIEVADEVKPNLRRRRYVLADYTRRRLWDAEELRFCPPHPVPGGRNVRAPESPVPDVQDTEVQSPELQDSDVQDPENRPRVSKEVVTTKGVTTEVVMPPGKPSGETRERANGQGDAAPASAGAVPRQRADDEVETDPAKRIAASIAVRWVAHPMFAGEPIPEAHRVRAQLTVLVAPYVRTWLEDPKTGYSEADVCRALESLRLPLPSKYEFDKTLRAARRPAESPAAGRPRPTGRSGGGGRSERVLRAVPSALNVNAAWGVQAETPSTWGNGTSGGVG